MIIAIIPVLSCEQKSNSHSSLRWTKLQEIVASVKEPGFPENTCNLIDFGGISDGITDNKPAFDSIINFCSSNGGGKIVVGPGIYLINGPVHLRSNINLLLQEGARIIFGSNPADYREGIMMRC